MTRRVERRVEMSLCGAKRMKTQWVANKQGFTTFYLLAEDIIRPDVSLSSFPLFPLFPLYPRSLNPEVDD